MRPIKALILCATLIGWTPVGASSAWAQGTPSASRYQAAKAEANDHTVTIAASGTTSPYTRVAEDMRDVLDDPENNSLRILPVLGRGGGQNLLDILFLRGVDMGIVDQDHLTRLKAKDPALFGDLERRVHYVVKLFNSEFQVLARNQIKSYEDLRGKKVNFFKQNSSTAIGAENIFKALGIEVEPVFYDQALANDKLRKGEIDAMIRFAGAPHAAFRSFKASEGFHFVPLSEETLPSGKFNIVLDQYLPATLKHEFYPDLIPQGETVPTVANSTLLAVYAWPEGSERYRKVANFVNALFDNIDKFDNPARHPKWKEISLSADVKGWTRFKASQDWLDTHAPGSNEQTEAIKAAFESFLRGSQQAAVANLAPDAREALFRQFSEWWLKSQNQRR